MKSITTLLWGQLLLLLSLSSFGGTLAFSANRNKQNINRNKVIIPNIIASTTPTTHHHHNIVLGSFLTPKKKLANAVLASVSTVFTSSVGIAMAEVDGMDGVEMAELPPPIVPLVFAFALLVGVGFLTSSLGDVYSDEASLGMQSGAQAKKERERSQASYFKKR
eukprot:CAMPEP_0197824098 /NCGR_PEP_ID=MMETSP1437-20131217/1405_1 /TAXON_ID=49252 ORGANISM="Eucampia antarctica, Strain CCMP1452" /NCGR_SAMPLE_ID=MMETSP1437 /ASSEMBLY_ACC=CAM_ASM_001096 /LENGTH=163 /DNA_ID=CAMNT_0043423597 /DNA_START=45 /DNA_END=536 /DNA_ORIENTATION=+